MNATNGVSSDRTAEVLDRLETAAICRASRRLAQARKQTIRIGAKSQVPRTPLASDYNQES